RSKRSVINPAPRATRNDDRTIAGVITSVINPAPRATRNWGVSRPTLTVSVINPAPRATRNEQLVSQLPVEALDVPVLPGRAKLDVQGLHTDLSEPAPHRLGRKLGPVVRADVPRHAPRRHQPGKTLEHVIAPQASGHIDRQALPGVLVDHRQHAKSPALMRATLHEVVAPDMVFVLCSKPDAAP